MEKKFDSKKLKMVLIPIVCILVMGGMYVLKSGGGSTPPEEEEIVDDVTPVFGAFEASVDQEESLKKSKSELYQEDYKSQIQLEAERKRAEKQDPTRIATRISTFGEEKQDVKYFGPEHYQDSDPNLQTPVFGQTEPPVQQAAPVRQPVQRRAQSTYTNRSSQVKKEESISEPAKEEKPVDDGFGLDVFASGQQGMDDFDGGQYGQPTGGGQPSAATDAVIEASIYGDHNVRPGEVIRFRLTEPATISGVSFPRNSIFTAKSTFNGDRMHINTTTLEQKGKRVVADLICHDQDQMVGISIPYSAVRDGATETSTDAVDDIISESTGSLRIISSAAKTITDKLAREQTVFIRDGYKVTFRPNER